MEIKLKKLKVWDSLPANIKSVLNNVQRALEQDDVDYLYRCTFAIPIFPSAQVRASVVGRVSKGRALRAARVPLATLQ